MIIYLCYFFQPFTTIMLPNDARRYYDYPFEFFLVLNMLSLFKFFLSFYNLCKFSSLFKATKKLISNFSVLDIRNESFFSPYQRIFKISNLRIIVFIVILIYGTSAKSYYTDPLVLIWIKKQYGSSYIRQKLRRN